MVRVRATLTIICKRRNSALPTNKEIKQNALKALKLSRGDTITLSIITIFLGGVSLFAFTISEGILLTLSGLMRNEAITGNLRTALWVAYIAAALYLLLSILVGSFVELGYDRMLLFMLRQQPVGNDVLFGFREKHWFDSIMLRLYMAMKSILWMILLFVPGLVAIVNYAMAPFVIAQFPYIKPPEAVKVSKTLMKGYRLKLVLLVLSFLDEILISFLALGLPLFYVIPRIKICVAEFYKQRVSLHDEQVRQIAREANAAAKK